MYSKKDKKKAIDSKIKESRLRFRWNQRPRRQVEPGCDNAWSAPLDTSTLMVSLEANHHEILVFTRFVGFRIWS